MIVYLIYCEYTDGIQAITTNEYIARQHCKERIIATNVYFWYEKETLEDESMGQIIIASTH